MCFIWSSIFVACVSHVPWPVCCYIHKYLEKLAFLCKRGKVSWNFLKFSNDFLRLRKVVQNLKKPLHFFYLWLGIFEPFPPSCLKSRLFFCLVPIYHQSELFFCVLVHKYIKVNTFTLILLPSLTLAPPTLVSAGC